jgi:hypothetical protein
VFKRGKTCEKHLIEENAINVRLKYKCEKPKFNVKKIIQSRTHAKPLCVGKDL